MLNLADLWVCLLRHTETKPTHIGTHEDHNVRGNAKQLQVQRVLAEAEQAQWICADHSDLWYTVRVFS